MQSFSLSKEKQKVNYLPSKLNKKFRKSCQHITKRELLQVQNNFNGVKKGTKL